MGRLAAFSFATLYPTPPHRALPSLNDAALHDPPFYSVHVHGKHSNVRLTCQNLVDFSIADRAWYVCYQCEDFDSVYFCSACRQFRYRLLRTRDDHRA
ncbi:uncharacterized protein LAESUDRAFT_564258 [Laetiporus sulphureus 93-53]|uniref:Uncharacterized protein n=1 Tax=Laetiporus sulphureus 93-53 TaxID=1314785 RepID=A0A165B4B8_9APHY|nr:uncharacterized protein LAESUDRAFT_564258 [Laetiporus sulphureus 93-53]KZT00202.1 hypothetical protein LAESUDRAFT_564258 [Laetiporus sulphureus 93-53]